jgi:predicted ribosome quality control (RQC) complex YloA/Tae2 family protein
VTAEELQQIAAEIRTTLAGRKFGRLFPLGRTAFAVDFHPHNGAYLFIDISPRHRSIYLIVRKLKVLERDSVNLSSFQLRLRQALSGFDLVGVMATDDGIVLRLENSEGRSLFLFVLVNGEPADLILADGSGTVIEAAREDLRRANVPIPPMPAADEHAAVFETHDLSAVLDKKRLDADAAGLFQKTANEVQKSVTREIAKRHKLLANLDGDLRKHGDAARWKKYGDLILASLPNPKKEGEHFRLVDFFDPDQPEILIPTGGDESPKLTAEKYFKSYRKAVNAVDAIRKRKLLIEAELSRLNEKLEQVDAAIENKDSETLQSFLKPAQLIVEKPKKNKTSQDLKGVRKFASSNGFEILVGKKAKDNDHLTFRIARSLDTWLHAADYPGSHVVIRNPNRKEIPPQTLIEAASLAAFYSDARGITKAAVNYTQRKFVNKPKRGAPGLVSLSSFKTLVVKPEIPANVKKGDD